MVTIPRPGASARVAAAVLTEVDGRRLVIEVRPIEGGETAASGENARGRCPDHVFGRRRPGQLGAPASVAAPAAGGR